KNAGEPPRKSCASFSATGSLPTFSSVNVVPAVSSGAPRAVTTPWGGRVKTTLGEPGTTVTATDADSGPAFVGSHPATARTRWYTTPSACETKDAEVDAVVCASRRGENPGESARSTTYAPNASRRGASLHVRPCVCPRATEPGGEKRMLVAPGAA